MLGNWRSHKWPPRARSSWLKGKISPHNEANRYGEEMRKDRGGIYHNLILSKSTQVSGFASIHSVIYVQIEHTWGMLDFNATLVLFKPKGNRTDRTNGAFRNVSDFKVAKKTHKSIQRKPCIHTHFAHRNQDVIFRWPVLDLEKGHQSRRSKHQPKVALPMCNF